MPKGKKEEICCVQDWGVVIPLRDFQKMITALKDHEELQKEYAWTKKEIQALRSLLSETWEKIAEIDKML